MKKHTKKHNHLEKNSFTLLETLLSLTLITFVIGGFLHSFNQDSTNHENFMLLNNLENRFDTNDYSTFSKTTKNLKIIKNNTDISFENVTSYEFKNENIKLVKYEK